MPEGSVLEGVAGDRRGWRQQYGVSLLAGISMREGGVGRDSSDAISVDQLSGSAFSLNIPNQSSCGDALPSNGLAAF